MACLWVGVRGNWIFSISNWINGGTNFSDRRDGEEQALGRSRVLILDMFSLKSVRH